MAAEHKSVETGLAKVPYGQRQVHGCV
jgi:hypothetical protein